MAKSSDNPFDPSSTKNKLTDHRMEGGDFGGDLNDILQSALKRKFAVSFEFS